MNWEEKQELGMAIRQYIVNAVDNADQSDDSNIDVTKHIQGYLDSTEFYKSVESYIEKKFT